MKLLIVDDNADTRRLIRAMVRPWSDDIIEGRNGEEAVASYTLHRPDWVLMDVEMHDMDGIAAARIIRQRDPTARIIMVTTFDDPRLRSAAEKVGASGYVLKDNLMELQSLLKRQ